jgi:hypothetical protein
MSEAGEQSSRSSPPNIKRKQKDDMNHITGSFAGEITQQSTLTLTDQPNHAMNIAEVRGTQKSSDPLWNNSKIAYWGVTDLLDGKGTQRGYYDNNHGGPGRDWGTFEARVTTVGGGMIVEGTFKFTGGDGEYRGITGGGTFKSVMKSETELECTWDGNYELAKAQAR